MRDFLQISLGDLLTVITMVASMAWMAGKLRNEISQLSRRIDEVEEHLTNLTTKLDVGVDKMSAALLQIALHEHRISALEARIDGHFPKRRGA